MKVSNQNSWEGELFNRKSHAKVITSLIERAPYPLVLNLNSPWGTGKTYFLKNWSIDLKPSHPVIYYNAWEKDYFDDPLPPFIHSLTEQIRNNNYISKKKVKLLQNIKNTSGVLFKSILPSAMKGLLQHYIGQEATEDIFILSEDDEENFSDVAEKLIEKSLLLQKRAEDSVTKFKIALSTLLKTVFEDNPQLEPPFIILIDELDRCRPNLALEFLEKVKHFYNIDNVVFVIATDTNELSHACSAVYGEKFNGTIYLKRFFDRECSLPLPNNQVYINTLLKKYGYMGRSIEYRWWYPVEHGSFDNFSSCFTTLSYIFDLSLRDIEQCFVKFDSIVNSWGNQGSLHIYWILFLLTLNHKNPNLYQEYLNPRSTEKIFDEIFSKHNITQHSKFGLKDIQNAQLIVRIYNNILLHTNERIEQLFAEKEEEYSINSQVLNIRVEANFLEKILGDYHNLENYDSYIQQVAFIS